MVDLPAPRRERLSSRLADLARMLRKGATPDDVQRVAGELERLAVGG